MAGRGECRRVRRAVPRQTHDAGALTMKASTIRTFTTVHTWTGLLAGFALFVAFYAGALTMFHDEIDTWALPRAEATHDDTLRRAALMLDGIVAAHPAAREQIGLTFPASRAPSQQVAA